MQLRTNAASSVRAAVTALWGNKALDNVVDLDLTFDVERDKHATKRLAALQPDQDNTNMALAASLSVFVKGLISKFSVNQGRSGTDRQFFYINGRPCNLSKASRSAFYCYLNHIASRSRKRSMKFTDRSTLHNHHSSSLTFSSLLVRIANLVPFARLNMT